MKLPGYEPEKANVDQPPRCPFCDYDLSCSPGAVCPECGKESSQAERLFAPEVPHILIRVGAVGLLAVLAPALAWSSCSPHGPTLGSPCNMFMCIPWIIGLRLLGDVIVFGIAIFVSWPLLRNRVGPTIPSFVSPVLVWIGSSAWISFGAKHGIQYQGGEYVGLCAAFSACALITLIAAWRFGRRKPFFAIDAIQAFILVSWASTYAFPYLGELP